MVSRAYLTIVLLVVLVFYSCSNEPQSSRIPNNAKSMIDAVMDAQETAWNNGDLDSFMVGYWESDSLLFIGKSGLREGFQTTLSNYKKSYPSKEAMGRLKFTNLKYEPLGAEHMLVIGKWVVKRDSMPDLNGHYSLTWKLINGNWVIIADHSS